MRSLEDIPNFLRINDQLATGGMPEPGDFSLLRQAGFGVVINLALPTSDGAIPNEGELVSREEMTYVHVPVKFDSPQAEDFERFSGIVESCAGESIFVHCVANFRVAAFVFLHRLRHHSDRQAAENDLLRIWKPDEVWQTFMNERLTEWNQPPLDAAST
jgi:protein tyrosine phosphatase (PTP) superfamily phosphohydrolase (DUF442 family)